MPSNDTIKIENATMPPGALLSALRYHISFKFVWQW